MKHSLSIISIAALLTAACSTEITVPETVDIIPAPAKMELAEGAFKVPGAPVSFEGLDELSASHVNDFASRLSLTTGKKSKVSSQISENGISFTIQEGMPAESYSIDITPASVKVVAADDHGILYSIQTLSQMLPVEFFGKKAAKDANWALRCSSIQDQPRFAYRGMHLDCCRHFFAVEEVEKLLDVMALHKMNRLHWHISEDQGWRIEIKKYPKLTEVGSIRKGTMILKDFESNDGVEYGGFYTQEEARGIVEYAARLGITVIPEIDLPGHMMGALAAYPELGCTGGPYEVWTKWGVSDQVLCPGKEGTMKFLEDVLSEIIEIFPSEYIHIGGDECPKSQWAVCPDCQAKIKELGLKSDATASAETRLQNYVTARIQKFLNDKGRKIIGWDEILEGELAPGATVMSWRGVAGGIEAAKKGYDAIMTPSTYLYFDYYQTDKHDVEPLAIGGHLPIEKVYSYEPYDGIPESAQHHILGVQANIWTEFIAKPEHLEYMTLPRMDAASEVQWCPAGTKDFERFKANLEHMGKIYDTLGYTWCHAVFGEYGLPGVPGGTN